jgi:3-deoxy-D-manno-octulosonic-acid transferase
MKLVNDIAFAAAAIVSSPVWGYRLLKTGKWRTDWSGRFGRGPVLSEDRRRTLLIHGVSVGEVKAARALVDELWRRHGDRVRVVVSATTNTGYDTAQELFGERIDVVRYPFDLSAAVGRFLDRIRPDTVALMELELWPTMVEECHDRGIPVAVISGRLSASSHRSYARIRALVRPTFARLAVVAAQTETYAARFRDLGVRDEQVVVSDSMKWDAARVMDEVPGSDALAEAMGIDPGRPLVVAGSTGPGEEMMLLAGRPDGVQLLVAPRKPERFSEVAALEADWIRRSACPDGSTRAPSSKGLFLLDTMGELAKAYSLADVAVVGRSFRGDGGSDPIEPIALGTPTIIGPDHVHFSGVVDAFQRGGGIVVSDDPWTAVLALLEDPARRATLAAQGREVIHVHRGATDRTLSLLLSLLGLAGRG